MRRLFALGFVVSALLACGAHEDEGFKLIHVADLVALRSAPDHTVAVADANGTDFRTREGVIPGAILLSSFRSYDVAKELPAPKDTALVFYCADPH